MTKKIFGVFLIGTSVIALASCGSDPVGGIEKPKNEILTEDLMNYNSHSNNTMGEYANEVGTSSIMYNDFYTFSTSTPALAADSDIIASLNGSDGSDEMEGFNEQLTSDFEFENDSSLYDDVSNVSLDSTSFTLDVDGDGTNESYTSIDKVTVYTNLNEASTNGGAYYASFDENQFDATSDGEDGELEVELYTLTRDDSETVTLKFINETDVIETTSNGNVVYDNFIVTGYSTPEGNFTTTTTYSELYDNNGAYSGYDLRNDYFIQGMNLQREIGTRNSYGVIDEQGTVGTTNEYRVYENGTNLAHYTYFIENGKTLEEAVASTSGLTIDYGIMDNNSYELTNPSTYNIKHTDDVLTTTIDDGTNTVIIEVTCTTAEIETKVTESLEFLSNGL